MMPQEEIQIADISKELERQWEEQKAKHQVRASLFNLILYCHEPHRVPYFEEFIQTLVERFPCRIFFIQGELNPAQNYLKVSVSNVITSDGELSIACDEIHIAVTTSQMRRVPFIILPHLLADLPIYLLWGQDPTRDNTIFPHLQGFAHRLIFDSESAHDLPRFSRALQEMREKGKFEVVDMIWAAVGGWRDVFASTFDTQEKVLQLRDAKTISITYNGAKTEWIKHPEIQAFYLQAWLAAEMEWKVVSRKESTLTYHNGEHEVHIDLVSQETGVPGTILTCEVVSAQEHIFSMARNETLQQVIVHISTLEECADALHSCPSWISIAAPISCPIFSFACQVTPIKKRSL